MVIFCEGHTALYLSVFFIVNTRDFCCCGFLYMLIYEVVPLHSMQAYGAGELRIATPIFRLFVNFAVNCGDG